MNVEFLRQIRLLAAAGFAAAGACAGKSFPPGFPGWILLPAAAALLILFMWAALRGGGAGTYVLLCAALLLAGTAAGYYARSRWAGREGNHGKVRLEGLVEIGRRGEDGFTLSVVGVEKGSPAEPGDCFLVKKRDGEGDLPAWGERVEVEGELYVFPGAWGRVGGTITVESLDRLGGKRGPVTALAEAFRESVLREGEKVGDPSVSGLVEGMLLGDYRRLPERDLEALRSSGLAHLCAASGLHLGMLVGMLYWAGKKLRLSRRAVVLLQVPPLLLYSVSVGMTISVRRAMVVVMIAGAAYLAGRDFDFLSAMGAALLYVVFTDPSGLGTVGFQLSFAAALGIGVIEPVLSRRLRARKKNGTRAFTACIAAQLALAPLLLHHFGEVPILSPLANLLATPVVPLVMALGTASAFLGTAGLPLARFPLVIASPLARWILGVGRFLAAPSWGRLVYSSFPAWGVLAWYLLLAPVFLGGGWVKRTGVFLSVSVAIFLFLAGPCPRMLPAMRGSDLVVTFLDVGQGDAVLVEGPGGETVLVDGGEDEELLATELSRRGVERLDVVVVSHDEKDHVGGLVRVLERFSVGILLYPRGRLEERGEDLLKAAREGGATEVGMERGDRLEAGELLLEAVGPPPGMKEEKNDASLVLMLRWGEFRVLLTGDVEEAGERSLLQSGLPLQCDVLKVPHHGGYSALNGAFFREADPLVAVISVGRDNGYGHPHAATLAELEEAGCTVYRTDLCGDIFIRVGGEGLEVGTERAPKGEKLERAA